MTYFLKKKSSPGSSLSYCIFRIIKKIPTEPQIISGKKAAAAGAVSYTHLTLPTN